MAETKQKGSVAEIAVLQEAVRRGYRVSIPYGEDGLYDLVVDRSGRLERVQCKYVQSDGRVLVVKCVSTNNWGTRRYTVADVEWLAVIDATTNRCYFIPSALIGSGRSVLHLRLDPARNGQERRVRYAADFLEW